MEITINVNVLLTVLAIATPIIVMSGRYFLKKEKCFAAMKNKIDKLYEHDEKSLGDHDGYDARFDEMDSRFNKIEKKQATNEVYLKLLLDDRKIKYN